MLVAVSVMMRRLVLGCTASALSCDTSGRRRPTASVASRCCSGTIWVSTSPPAGPFASSRPTTVRSGACAAPSRGMMR